MFFYFSILFPNTPTSAPSSPQNNVDNLEKNIIPVAGKNALPKHLRHFVVNPNCSRGWDG